MALAGGDIQTACANRVLMVFDQLQCGDQLTQVKEAVSNAQKVSKFSENHMIFYSP